MPTLEKISNAIVGYERMTSNPSIIAKIKVADDPGVGQAARTSYAPPFPSN
jgi:hypothetical protein